MAALKTFWIKSQAQSTKLMYFCGGFKNSQIKGKFPWLNPSKQATPPG